MVTPSPGLRFQVWNRNITTDHLGIMELLECLAGSPFAPDRYGTSEPLSSPFSSQNLEEVWQLISRAEGEPPVLFLKRRNTPRSRYYLSWGTDREPFGTEVYNLLGNEKLQHKWLSAWMDFTQSVPLKNAWMARWGTADEAQHHTWLTWTVPNGHPRIQAGVVAESGMPFRPLLEGIPDLQWGNYFGPFYVEWLGRDVMTTLPAYSMEETPEGGIFFTTAPSPWEWHDQETNELKKRIRQHLGNDKVFDIDAFRRQLAATLGMIGIYEPRQLLPHLSTPIFPFSVEEAAKQSTNDDIIHSWQALGYTLIDESEQRLVFRNDYNDVIEVGIGDERYVSHRSE